MTIERRKLATQGFKADGSVNRRLIALKGLGRTVDTVSNIIFKIALQLADKTRGMSLIDREFTLALADKEKGISLADKEFSLALKKKTRNLKLR